ncbi:ArsR/SmtB family transcription factor [Caloranaerobacter azorensis]|uniref:Winged helix-turn-helix transcriptional regulator n=1 Tax=Caloranaerobacter azorensis TaxID=116090 RepID=A0A6P1YI46_9FIRM|nr:metalloregulator ArsR/SmtB family transcription factor [Caloranaerobacter azorensis]QIB27546.1 winged helix-turn-helix transcriptional regulator [Caloranaerobacter azorensis]
MDKNVEVFKALSDKNRLLIIDMLSCGELCNCDIMEQLNLTQPTISHHMKILQHSGLINSRKEGKWIYYSINKKAFDNLCYFIKTLSSYKEDCICKNVMQKKCNREE